MSTEKQKGEKLKNILIAYDQNIYNPNKTKQNPNKTKTKTMERINYHNQQKIDDEFNEKKYEMLMILKSLKPIVMKEKHCLNNYKNFIDNALSNGSNMSEKDCHKFFRLGAEINTILSNKKEIVQKLSDFDFQKKIENLKKENEKS